MPRPVIMGSRLNECMYFNSSGNKNVEGEKEKSYIMQSQVIFFNCLTCQVGRCHLKMKREIKVEDREVMTLWTSAPCENYTQKQLLLLDLCDSVFFSFLLFSENSLASMTHLDKHSFCGTFPREFPATYNTSHTLCLPIYTVCEGHIFLKLFFFASFLHFCSNYGLDVFVCGTNGKFSNNCVFLIFSLFTFFYFLADGRIH